MRISLLQKINLIIWAILIIGASSFVISSAARMWGRESNYGYFDNKYDGYGSRVFPNGIPESVNSANDLVYTLQTTYYKSGNAQQKTGAAFVANTVLWGNDGNEATRNISDADWSALLKKLQGYESAGLMKWNQWVSCTVFDGVNSYYQGTGSGTNPDDDAYVSSDDDCSGQLIEVLYIMNSSGEIGYAIKYECGNPVGYVNLDSLSVTPTVDVNPESVLPGQKITWSHGVILSGVGSASSLKYQYKMYSSASGGSSTGSGSLVDASDGAGTVTAYDAHVAPNGYSEYTPTATDIGKTFCRSTFATAVINGVTSTYESARACATVASSVASGVCRPITITVPAHTRAVGNKRDGQTGTAALSVTLNVVNKTTNQSVFRRSYTAETKVDLTVQCTTGDQFTATITIPSHIERWEKYKRSCANNDPPCSPKYYYRSISATHSLTSSSTIGPCYDYVLKPAVSAVSNYQVEVGANVTISPTIGNSSWTKEGLTSFWNTYKTSTKSKATEWQVSRLKVNSGKTIPSLNMATSASNACDYYKSKGFDNCAAEKTGTGVIFDKDTATRILSGANPLTAISAVIGDEPAGTKVCFAFSVRSANSEGPTGSNNESATPSSTWYHSATAQNICVIVVKKPKVQVWGGDIKAGRSFNGTISTLNVLTLKSVKSISGRLLTFGSWAEYGVYAAGTIRGIGSASSLNGGITVNSQSDYSKLTFSNSGLTSRCSSTVNGCYTYRKSTVPDISASFPAGSTTKTVGGNVNLDSLTSGVYRATSNITITGGSIEPGKWIVINALDNSRDVVVSGNIKYSDTKVTKISDIPQVVIMARNIDIADNVRNVDAWLIAKNGYLNTCQSNLRNGRTQDLSTADCKNSLTINGPVMVSTLFLRRTAGSGTGASSDAPAEVFNLRADAYLWAYARATSSGRVWTVYTSNVPARL